jgi:gliding motility-associated-like protein
MNFIRSSSIAVLVILASCLRIQAQADDCGNAVRLTNVKKYCSNPQQFTNAGFTASNALTPACWVGNAAMDGWFYFTAVGTDVLVTVSGEPGKGTIKNPNIELISGTCNGPSIACSAPGNNNLSTLYKGGLIPGANYYIRVATTTANRGTFTLCVNSYNPVLNPGADCDGAVRLCDKSPISVIALSGPGKNSKEIESSSCFFSVNTPAGTSVESNSSWYWWTCEESGSLTFTITPNDPKDDIDFIVYELEGENPCGKRTIIRCTATQCKLGPNGLDSSAADVNEPTTNVINNVPQNCQATYNGFLKYVNMVAGKSYALFINNFSASSGFSISFGGSTIFKGPKAVISSGTSPFICKGESVTYDGSSSQFYDSLAWVFTGGNPATASTVGPHKINYYQPGVYIAYLKAMNKTCASGNSIDSLKVTIHAPPDINASNAVIGNTDCDKPTGSITGIKVNGAPDFVYEWFSTPPDSSVFTSTTTADLDSVSPGKYFLVITDVNGCSDTTGNFEVKKYDIPPTPGVSNNIPRCEGVPPITITASGSGGTYVWYDDAALTDTLHIGPDYTPSSTITDTLYLTESVHGCTSKVDTFVVIVHDLPVVDAGPLKHIWCSSPTVKMEGSASGGNMLSYEWSPTSGIVSDGNTLNPIINEAGMYTLTVKNDDTGCIRKDEVQVVKDPVPVANFSADVIKGEDPLSVNFTNNSTGANTYLWIFDDQQQSTDKNPTHVFTVAPKVYHVLLIASDNNLCPDSIMVEINVLEKFTVEIPNVFTPNGDGQNDIFTINATGIEQVSGEIYDRWGMKLYSWEQKKGGWDGRSLTGEMAPDGTYYYILKIKPLGDKKETYIKAGHLTLLR